MFQSISKEEAIKLAKKNENNENFVVIDIRTEGELDDGVMKNALNIDFYSTGFENNLNKLDKKKTFLIYCRSGNRSKAALETMKELGFENVYEIDEGILG